MKEYIIRLDNSEKLKSFSKFISQFSFQINALEGRKAVNAKSVSKLLLLNLDNEIKIHAYINSLKEYQKFEKGIGEYIYE